MAFDDYLNSRTSLLDQTQKTLDNANNKNQNAFSPDPDDWYPGTDKSGNGIAVIRFLPPIEGEDIPFVEWFSHSFQNPITERWYIENSLKTLGKEHADPVAEYNSKLWKSTTDEEHPNRKQASAQKRMLNYRSNIFVISDSANPENNGTIKKYKYGKTIFDLIRLSMNPPVIEGAEEQEAKVNPFDLVEGADLKIQIFSEKKGGKLRRNYSKTKFKDPAPLGDMKLMRKIYDELQSDPKRWSLKAYIAADKFKSYDDLKKRLDYVSGINTATGEKLVEEKSQKTEEKSTSPKTGKEASPAKKDGEDYFSSLLDNDDE